MIRLTTRNRRYLETVGFVAVWMAIGFGLDATALGRLDAANCYLLVGIPLVIFFQRYVRKKPFVGLWRRNSQQFSLGRIGLSIAVLLASPPVYELATIAIPKSSWPAMFWAGAAMFGALGAAFCLERTSLAELRRGFPSFLAACAIGVAMMMLGALSAEKSPFPTVEALPVFVQQFLLYFVVCFCLEEVAFRGLLDTHIEPDAATGSRGWPSAIAVSVLWGLWHLPVVPLPSASAAAVMVPAVCVIHGLVGVPLSFCWRSTGSLLLPAAAHALIDAFRNVVLLG